MCAPVASDAQKRKPRADQVLRPARSRKTCKSNNWSRVGVPSASETATSMLSRSTTSFGPRKRSAMIFWLSRRMVSAGSGALVVTHAACATSSWASSVVNWKWRFARIVDQVEAIAARPVFEGKSARQVRGCACQINRLTRAIARHAHPPRPDADRRENAKKTDQELHQKSVARPMGTRHTNCGWRCYCPPPAGSATAWACART
jgi:hypothetical protein